MHGITSSLTSEQTFRLMKAPDGNMIQVPIQETIIESITEVDDGFSVAYKILSPYLPQTCHKIISNDHIDEVIKHLRENTVDNYNKSANIHHTLEPIRKYIAKLLFEKYIENVSMELYYYEELEKRAIKDIVFAVSTYGFPDDNHQKRVNNLSEIYQKMQKPTVKGA